MLKCLAAYCAFIVTYCAQIMLVIIIIIERHTTTILMVCYTEASNLDWLQLEITQMSQIRRSDESDQTLRSVVTVDSEI